MKNQAENHIMNTYDRMFLKELDFGSIMPVAVIKNCDDEVKASLEHWVDYLNGKHKNQSVDFGKVTFRGNEYYIVATEDVSVRANLMSQGVMLEHFVSNNDAGIKCYFFDHKNDLMDAGVSPVLRFEMRDKLSEKQKKEEFAEINKQLRNGEFVNEDFDIYAEKKEDEDAYIVYLRQKSSTELSLTMSQVKARYLALNVLSERRDAIFRVHNMNLFGVPSKGSIGKEEYDIAEKRISYAMESYDSTTDPRRHLHTIKTADLNAIREIKLDKGKVVVSILKNPPLRPADLVKYCKKIATRRGIEVCEVMTTVSPKGDNLMFTVVDEKYAGVYAKYASYLKGIMFSAISKTGIYSMVNVDKDGHISSVDRRLLAKVKSDDKYMINRLQKRFDSNEDCVKINPSIESFGRNEYGVYVDNGSLRTQNNQLYRPATFAPTIDVIEKCGLRYELTDAYGNVVKTGGSSYLFASEKKQPKAQEKE